MTLFSLLITEETTVKLLQDTGVLPSERVCHLKLYLAEFIWRQLVKERGNIFESLLKATNVFWPPEIQY